MLKPSSLAVIGSCIGFVVIGAFQSLYGPLIPVFLGRFDITTSQAGFSLSGNFIGALIGVIAFRWLSRSFSDRLLLAVSYALMAGGGCIFAMAPRWDVALIGTFIIGLGFGGIDFGLNVVFSNGFGSRSAAMTNLLNGHFGIGAILGPALVGMVSPDRYSALFLTFALISAALIATVSGRKTRRPDVAQDAAQGNRSSPQGAVLIVCAFTMIYILHVAIETGVGGWEPTHLQSIGFTAAMAAAATSVYWFSLTAGRFIVAIFGRNWQASTVVVASCIGMTCSLLAAQVDVLAPYAYACVGLFIAPIFPTGLVWLNRLAPTSQSATAFVIASSMIGGVVFPPVIGKVISLAGVHRAPLMLSVLAVVCVASSGFLIYREILSRNKQSL